MIPIMTNFHRNWHQIHLVLFSFHFFFAFFFITVFIPVQYIDFQFQLQTKSIPLSQGCRIFLHTEQCNNAISTEGKKRKNERKQKNCNGIWSILISMQFWFLIFVFNPPNQWHWMSWNEEEMGKKENNESTGCRNWKGCNFAVVVNLFIWLAFEGTPMNGTNEPYYFLHISGK